MTVESKLAAWEYKYTLMNLVKNEPISLLIDNCGNEQTFTHTELMAVRRVLSAAGLQCPAITYAIRRMRQLPSLRHLGLLED